MKFYFSVLISISVLIPSFLFTANIIHCKKTKQNILKKINQLEIDIQKLKLRKNSILIEKTPSKVKDYYENQ